MLVSKLIFAFSCLMAAAAVAQTLPARPSTQSDAADDGMLLHGKLSYEPPHDWTSKGVRTDGRSAGYGRDEKPAGLIVISAVPQQSEILPQLGNKLFEQIAATIKAEAAKGNIESVQPPKRISDKRFLLEIHDQFRSHGKFCDRTQYYLAVGHNLVSVVATAFSTEADDQKSVATVGATLATSAKIIASP